MARLGDADVLNQYVDENGTAYIVEEFLASAVYQWFYFDMHSAILSHKSKNDINELLEIGPEAHFESNVGEHSTLTVLCAEMNKISNDYSAEMRNLLDILNHMLRIGTHLTPSDVRYISYICFSFQNLIQRHVRVKRKIDDVRNRNDRFRELPQEFKHLENELIHEDYKCSVNCFIRHDIRKQAMILRSQICEKSLTSMVSRFW